MLSLFLDRLDGPIALLALLRHHYALFTFYLVVAVTFGQVAVRYVESPHVVAELVVFAVAVHRWLLGVLVLQRLELLLHTHIESRHKFPLHVFRELFSKVLYCAFERLSQGTGTVQGSRLHFNY